ETGNAAAGVRHNIPLQLTSFVGRAQDLAEVTQLLQATRLLTLTGPGGCGKTRLALQAAASVCGAHSDGVWLIELASLTDETLVAQTVAQVMGLRDSADLPALDALVRFLVDRDVLLLLDNCEHVIAAAAALVLVLLRACPHVRLLATSREPLGVLG